MSAQAPVEIGGRLELLVDDALLRGFQGDAQLRLHRPVPRGVALSLDRPWEGNGCNWLTVFADEEGFRLYYRGSNYVVEDAEGGPIQVKQHPDWVCLARSADGIQWHRPAVGQFEIDGSRDHNVVWQGAGEEQVGVQGFAPFLDGNPECEPAARFKAVGAKGKALAGKLYAAGSPDGISWSLLQQEPVITRGLFDSQNLAFWDGDRAEYRAYVRDFRGGHPGGQRDIRTATSPDFLHWSEPEWVQYPAAADEQLYHNQIKPYSRAPHILMGFPARYVELGREWSPMVEALPGGEVRRRRFSVHPRQGTALTEGLFMTSRDRVSFKRWGEAFLPPGPQRAGSWMYGDNYLSWGMIQTDSPIEGAPPELSLFATENAHHAPGTRVRRYAIRVDGFVSVNAPLSGGSFTTHPLTFAGSRLVLNVSTSAAGSVRVALLDAAGRPLPGYTVQDVIPVIGDELARTVRWRGGSDLTALAGTPVCLDVHLADADLYSFQFR